jgi:hypothetical protein
MNAPLQPFVLSLSKHERVLGPLAHPAERQLSFIDDSQENISTAEQHKPVDIESTIRHTSVVPVLYECRHTPPNPPPLVEL